MFFRNLETRKVNFLNFIFRCYEQEMMEVYHYNVIFLEIKKSLS